MDRQRRRARPATGRNHNSRSKPASYYDNTESSSDEYETPTNTQNNEILKESITKERTKGEIDLASSEGEGVGNPH